MDPQEKRPVRAPLRPFYLPILFAYPETNVTRLLGLDVQGRPQNAALRMGLMQTGQMATTPVFPDILMPSGARSVAVYHAIRHQTDQGEPGDFMGFLIMLLTPETLLRTKFGSPAQSRFFVRLLDQDDDLRQLAINRPDEAQERPVTASFRYPLAMPGRNWQMEIYSRAPLPVSRSSLLTLACMLLLSGLASFYVERGLARQIRLKARTLTLEAQRQELRRMAHVDSLTGLLNRRRLHDELVLRLAQAIPGRELALCMLDIDNFKQVNDIMGHACGDQLLIAIAQQLRPLIRPQDLLARLGGDEFVIVFPIRQAPEEILPVVHQILRLIPRVGQQITQGQVAISGSLGLSLSSPDNRDYGRLLHQADLAMYQAKKRGKNTYCLYQEGVDEQRTDEADPPTQAN